MSSKFEWTKETAPKPVRMEDLVCKDCFHRGGRVDICAQYMNLKPYEVLDGGDCPHYRKEKKNE